MNNSFQYYANRNSQGSSNKWQRNSGCVGPITNNRNFDYLLRNNFLSEYSTEEGQQEVLYNLGLLQRLSRLKQLIDAKVIESGGVVWDESPTSGNTDHVLSSDTIKQEFLKYYTKTQVDNLIQEIWSRIIDQIPNIDDNPNQLQELQQSIQSEISRAQKAEQAISDRVTELEEHGVNPEDNIKHVILTQEEYESISEPESNVLYIIVEPTESKFGDPFPFILG